MIYPNPANDYFQISDNEITSSGDYDITLSDLAGKILYNRKSNQLSKIRVSTVELNGGLYLLKVTDNNIHRTHNNKLIIVR